MAFRLTDEINIAPVDQSSYCLDIFQRGSAWEKKLKGLSSEQISQLIQEACKKEDSPKVLAHLIEIIPSEKFQLDRLRQLIEKICEKEDSPEVFEHLAHIIPLAKLQEIVRKDIGDLNGKDTLSSAQSVLKEAQHYLEIQKNSHRYSAIKATFNNILDGLIIFLESILDGLGIAEFFDPSDRSESKYKVQKLLTFSSIFALLTTLLLPLIGPIPVAWTIGGLFVTIAALSVIYPYISPAASYFPVGENWTKLLHENKLIAIEGRKESLNQIAQTLISGSDIKKHPILVGPSGIGKTETMKAFVQAVDRGDYPELKGKQIIYFNTADFVDYQDKNGKGYPILDRVSEIMGRHKDEYIFIFDEIQSAFKGKKPINDILKTKLDLAFPHVIGVTTEAEYDQYIAKDAAFCRRFKKISIQNPRSHETLAILANTVLRIAPKAMLEDDTLQYLLDRTTEVFKNSTQPLAAQKVLMSCIQAAADTQHSPLEQRAEELRSILESYYIQSASVFSLKRKPQVDEIEGIERELQLLEQEMSNQKTQITHLFKQRDQFALLKHQAMEVTLRAARLKKARDLSHFLLLNYFKLPKMKKSIEEEAKQYNIDIVINRQLIDRVITEELKNKTTQTKDLIPNETQKSDFRLG